MNNDWVRHLINQKKVIVLLGAGGVGKTSCSLGLALMAARQGKRVGLLSIDPAKRLAAALGLRPGQPLKEILFEEPCVVRGQLFASMLNPREVFDDMVRKYAPDKETAQKILNHRLYIAASSRLAGPAEYMALAKLQEMVSDHQYDLIILDTPPDQQALDFLSKPDILANFRENKVMNWLIMPFHMANKMGMGKLFSVGERLMGGLARVTGLEALRNLAEFLILIQKVIDGFQSVGENILSTLKSQDTGFLLVSSGQNNSFRSAATLASHLHRQSFQLNGVLFNKCLPTSIARSLAQASDKNCLVHPWMDQLLQRCNQETNGIKDFLNELNKNPLTTAKNLIIPEQKDCIHNKESLYEFSFSFARDSLSESKN